MVSSINSIMYSLEQLNEKNAKATYSLSTGNALEYGSDDSIKYNQILSIQNNINSYESISENISYNSSFNTASDSALSEIKTITESMISELIKANTDTTSQDEKGIIASELESYKENLLALANTSIDNMYIFSGQNTDIESFMMDESTGKVSYQSDYSTKTLNVEKGIYSNQGANGIDVFFFEEESVENLSTFTFSNNQVILDNYDNQWELVDIDGDDVFDSLYENGDISTTPISITNNGDGTYTAINSSTSTLSVQSSIFDLLDQTINALNLVDSDGNTISEDDADDIISSSLAKLNDAYDSQNIAHALIGTRTNTIEYYESSIETKLTNLMVLEEKYASADLTSLAVEAQALENTYTAIYSTINRVNSLSLINYLS